MNEREISHQPGLLAWAGAVLPGEGVEVSPENGASSKLLLVNRQTQYFSTRVEASNLQGKPIRQH